MSGIYLVTVPIGNKDDITARAITTLSESKYIYCEDTRVYKELCKRLGLDYSNKEIRSFHDHSSEKILGDIIEIAREEMCAFVSDAGSPIISDPAFPLILKALEEDIKLHSIGGISSVISSLELSGLAPIPFKFHGFLPRDKSKVRGQIELMGNEYGTHIFFEGKSRVIETVRTASELYPDFKFALARELTKQFESVYRFYGHEFESIEAQIHGKGEFVILMENNNKKSNPGMDKELIELALDIIDNGAKPKKLAKLLSIISGKPTKTIYQHLSGTRQ